MSRPDDTRVRRPRAQGGPARAGGPRPERQVRSSRDSNRDSYRDGRSSSRAGGTGATSGAGRSRSGGGSGPRDPRASRPLRVGLGNPRRRVRAMLLVVCFVFTVFAAQLVRLQGIDASNLSAQAVDSRTRTFALEAPRGAIVDRNGTPLAVDEERRDIVADPTLVAAYATTDKTTKKKTTLGLAGAAKALAGPLGVDAATLQKSLENPSSPKYTRLAVAVEPAVWRSVEKLDIPGLNGVKSTRRTYPGGESTAPLVGFVGADGRAKDGSGAGLEYLLDSQLAGTPGQTVREVSADGRIIPMGVDDTKPAVPGHDVRLTIDSDLNWFAHEAIVSKVEETKAESGTAVVMDLKGRLLAVAQSPGFDPNKPLTKSSVTGSLPFQEVFEPGSTAKAMSIGAALDQGVATPTSPYTVPDRMERGGKLIHDSHEHDVEQLTLAGIIAQSSNIGTMLATEQLAPAMIEKYYRAFGLGENSGVGFPGESKGILAGSDTWNSSQRYTMLYGQGLATTAVQATSVFQTIANGGVRMPASLVDSVATDDGAFTSRPLGAGRRVVSKKTADEMTLMLESVVGENGTAAQAGITGVPVAGKTGTANRYSGKGGMMASFVGFAPADKPQFIVGVFVANPQGGHYGGSVAGPVFQKIMSYALEKYGVAPTGETRTPYPLFVGQQPSSGTGQVDPGAIPDRGAPTAHATTPSTSPSGSSSSSAKPSGSSSGSSGPPAGGGGDASSGASSGPSSKR